MSGSNGGGGGGGGFEDYVDCSRLMISTQLSSPKPDVVAKLKASDELQVALDNQPGIKVVVALFNGQIAGGLASPETSRLRSCIEQGTNYNATVLDVTGGQVRVRVHPV
ncbi:hypothetical protein GJ700_02690 [Duganella sp. FT92W]|uniref:Uncharacterized protein n=2 Tax=Pseudoduganella rivuli TaxID=2666085 RepID=A0A7X2IIF3_9BURK|nr:hypothetical protein [Pseudoduganella rivuli]